MEIDFSKYSLEDLKSSLRGIDSDVHPERVREIEEQIQIRLSNPQVFIDQAIPTGLFSLRFPGDITFHVTVRIILWAVLFGLLIAIPLGTSIALLVLFTDVSEANGRFLLQVLQIRRLVYHLKFLLHFRCR